MPMPITLPHRAAVASGGGGSSSSSSSTSSTGAAGTAGHHRRYNPRIAAQPASVAELSMHRRVLQRQQQQQHRRQQRQQQQQNPRVQVHQQQAALAAVSRNCNGGIDNGNGAVAGASPEIPSLMSLATFAARVNQLKNKNNGSGYNSSGFNSSGVNGSGVNGSGVKVSGVNGRGVNVSGVNCSGVNVSGVKVSGINGSTVNGSGVNGSGVNGLIVNSANKTTCPGNPLELKREKNRQRKNRRKATKKESQARVHAQVVDWMAMKNLTSVDPKRVQQVIAQIALEKTYWHQRNKASDNLYNSRVRQLLDSLKPGNDGVPKASASVLGCMPVQHRSRSRTRPSEKSTTKHKESTPTNAGTMSPPRTRASAKLAVGNKESTPAIEATMSPPRTRASAKLAADKGESMPASAATMSPPRTRASAKLAAEHEESTPVTAVAYSPRSPSPPDPPPLKIKQEPSEEPVPDVLVALKLEPRDDYEDVKQRAYSPSYILGNEDENLYPPVSPTCEPGREDFLIQPNLSSCSEFGSQDFRLSPLCMAASCDEDEEAADDDPILRGAVADFVGDNGNVDEAVVTTPMEVEPHQDQELQKHEEQQQELDSPLSPPPEEYHDDESPLSPTNDYDRGVLREIPVSPSRLLEDDEFERALFQGDEEHATVQQYDSPMSPPNVFDRGVGVVVGGGAVGSLLARGNCPFSYVYRNSELMGAHRVGGNTRHRTAAEVARPDSPNFKPGVEYYTYLKTVQEILRSPIVYDPRRRIKYEAEEDGDD